MRLPVTIELTTDTDISLRARIAGRTRVTVLLSDGDESETIMDADFRDADGHHLSITLAKSVARAAVVASDLVVCDMDNFDTDQCIETVREGIAALLIAYGGSQGRQVGQDLLGCIVAEMTVRQGQPRKEGAK